MKKIKFYSRTAYSRFQYPKYNTWRENEKHCFLSNFNDFEVKQLWKVIEYNLFLTTTNYYRSK